MFYDGSSDISFVHSQPFLQQEAQDVYGSKVEEAEATRSVKCQ